jgi:hypothetical protein
MPEKGVIMTKRRVWTTVLSLLILPLLRAVPAMAIGDKVVPHVVDGIQGDGIRYRTKFDITNISPALNFRITKVTVLFFRNDGTPWTVGIKDPTDSSRTLNVSSYTPDFGTSQTIRIETLGAGALASGYAIVRNLETAWDVFPDAYEVALTVYFEVLARNSGGGYDIIDTVSVPAGQPTISFTFPVEIDRTVSPNLLTGFAMVNLTDTQNTVTMELWETRSPLTGNAVKYAQTANITLSSSQTTKKTVGFLHETQFFPNIQKFKGIAVATAQYPVSIMSLLQTPTPTGVQFATLVPAYLDALRRNTLMYLPQGFSLDADVPIVDYYRDETATVDDYYEMTWDLLFETIGTAGTSRRLTAQQGATFAVIGNQTVDQFDNITLSDLLDPAKYTFTGDFIDLNNGSTNLRQGFTFAIKTTLGRYARVRIRDVILREPDTVKDLTLEIYVYK